MTDRWRSRLARLDTVEPANDLWERAVSRSTEGVPAEAPPPRRQRLVAGIVAVLVAVGGSIGLFLTLRTTGPSPGQGTLITYGDPKGAWEISYPSRFQEGSIPEPSVAPRVMVEGVWISNFGAPPVDENSASPAATALPDDGVAVEVSQMFGGPGYVPEERDSAFPISIDDLRVVPGDYAGIWRSGQVVANGEPYTIQVRMGPAASEQDRKATAHIVSSFQILPLREGTTTGRHVTFYILAPPSSYAVGSVTRFDESNLPAAEGPLPFYLVYVEKGLYALAWPKDLVGGYKHCDVTYDPTAREFSCPNGARWALDGSVVAKPGPSFLEDPLAVLLVRISLDDHVLVSPSVFMIDTSVDLRVTSG